MYQAQSPPPSPRDALAADRGIGKADSETVKFVQAIFNALLYCRTEQERLRFLEACVTIAPNARAAARVYRICVNQKLAVIAGFIGKSPGVTEEEHKDWVLRARACSVGYPIPTIGSQENKGDETYKIDIVPAKDAQIVLQEHPTEWFRKDLERGLEHAQELIGDSRFCHLADLDIELSRELRRVEWLKDTYAPLDPGRASARADQAPELSNY